MWPAAPAPAPVPPSWLGCWLGHPLRWTMESLEDLMMCTRARNSTASVRRCVRACAGRPGTRRGPSSSQVANTEIPPNRVVNPDGSRPVTGVGLRWSLRAPPSEPTRRSLQGNTAAQCMKQHRSRTTSSASPSRALAQNLTPSCDGRSPNCRPDGRPASACTSIASHIPLSEPESPPHLLLPIPLVCPSIRLSICRNEPNKPSAS